MVKGKTITADEFGRYPIESTNLAATRWDGRWNEDTGVIEVQFRTGAVYRYYDVPFNIYRGLRRSKSAGKYFNAKIKGHYKYSRVS